MSGLEQVRQAVINTLCAAGLTAIPAFAGQAAQYDTAAVTVDVGAVSGKPAAMGSYLGETYDPEAGTVRELYGCRLDLTLTLGVWAPRAADCEVVCETAAETLLTGGLPSGLRLGEQRWEGVCWDKSNKLFLRKGQVEAKGFFIAVVDEESASLIDFTLKGVLME